MSLPWELHKETIKDFYVSHTLKEVMEFMSKEKKFNATKSQYESQFKLWQLKKYKKSDQWKAIGHKLRKRKREGKESEVYMDGELVSPQKVKKAITRPCAYVSATDLFISAPSPKTPLGVAIRTPHSEIVDTLIADNIFVLPCVRFQTWLNLTAISEFAPSSAFTTNSNNNCTGVFQEDTLSQLIHHHKRSEVRDSGAAVKPPEEYDVGPDYMSRESCLTESRPSSFHLLKLAVYVLSNKFLPFAYGARNPYEELALRWCCVPDNLKHFERLLRSKEPTMCALAEAIWEPALKTANVKLIRCLIAGMDFDIEHLIKFNHVEKLVSMRNIDELIRLLIMYVSSNMERRSEVLSYALRAGIRTGQVGLVKLLVAENVDVNLRVYDKMSPLEAAVECGNLEVVQILLRAGSDVNSYYETEFASTECALELAIQKDHAVLIGLLRGAGARLNFEGFDGVLRGVLPTAAETGNKSLVEELLKAGADIDSVDWREETALIKYIKNEELDMVVYLLGLGANTKPTVQRGYSFRTPLQAAINTDNDVFIRVLLGSGVAYDDPSLLQDAVRTGKLWLVQLILDRVLDAGVLEECEEIALQTSIECDELEIFRFILGRITDPPGHCLLEAMQDEDIHVPLEMVESFLQRGTDVDLAGGNRESTLLICAIRNGRHNIVQLLLNNNANVNKSSGGSSPLREAVLMMDTSSITRLLELGATPIDPGALSTAVFNRDTHTLGILLQAISTSRDVDEMFDSYGQPLLAAIGSCNTELIDFFLKAGGALNRRHICDYDGRSEEYQCFATPLEMAASKHTNAIQMLLDSGASPNIPFDNGYGITALVRSISRGDLEAVRLLLRYQANVNARPCRYHYKEQNADLTALQKAVKTGNPEMVQTILNAGADVHGHLGVRGLTALHLAASGGHVRIAGMLIQPGVTTDIDIVSSGFAWRSTWTYGFYKKTYRFRETRTALELAAEHGRLDVVQLLLNAGADLELLRYPNKKHERQGENQNPEQDGSAQESCWDTFVEPRKNPGWRCHGDNDEDSLPGDTQYEIATGLAKKEGHRAVARLITTFREHKIING
ncbi:ankyrin [Lophium mytilinum]|uniref:Ankyrin n=1 Tax=Lophium mytilinum TaxID=390894 RepID=A0A6A6RGI5_9PEZI|nr:ankyrin [Lophium mytilinum]